jgi:transposase InsO family protein
MAPHAATRPPPPHRTWSSAAFSRQPNQLWVAESTQQRTGEGWLYLAVVLDAFSRRVVG